MSDILWQPDANRIARSRMDAFRRFVNQSHSLNLDDYPALHQWSIDQREAFWQAIVDFFDIRFHNPPDAVLREGPSMPGAEWFPGATVNFAEHLLRRRDNAVAVVAVAENGQREQLTWAELAEHVGGFKPACKPPALASATGWLRACPTPGKRWWRCSQPPASAQSGRALHRTSAPTVSSTASARSNQRC